jgi:hypothetical protein
MIDQQVPDAESLPRHRRWLPRIVDRWIWGALVDSIAVSAQMREVNRVTVWFLLRIPSGAHQVQAHHGQSPLHPQ